MHHVATFQLQFKQCVKEFTARPQSLLSHGASGFESAGRRSEDLWFWRDCPDRRAAASRATINIERRRDAPRLWSAAWRGGGVVEQRICGGVCRICTDSGGRRRFDWPRRTGYLLIVGWRCCRLRDPLDIGGASENWPADGDSGPGTWKKLERANTMAVFRRKQLSNCERRP